MQKEQPRFLLILDFEATCGDAIKGQNEIIEFPTLLYNVEQDEVQATFHEYVRPVMNPDLTPFCTKLTGITQDVVDAASPFSNVWDRFQVFLKSHGLLDNPSSCIFLTCGHWDLRTMLPLQLDVSELEGPFGPDASGNLLAPYDRWINIKDAFRTHYRLRHNKDMLGMLRQLRLELEGRYHSGMDDCKNVLRIVRAMRSDGWSPYGEL
ncbi:exonuclease RNase T and DNA polymerase III [Amylocystis lapponica]|nr:exonuclease RNase T and DNA polymerase III [Amylocystis lapponica]